MHKSDAFPSGSLAMKRHVNVLGDLQRRRGLQTELNSERTSLSTTALSDRTFCVDENALILH